ENLRRWRAPGRFPDLLVRNADSETSVRAVEQDVLNELVGDAILNLLLVLARQATATLLAAVLVERGLVLLLEWLLADDGAVDLEDYVLAALYEVLHLTVGHPTNERDGDNPEDGLGNRLHRADHLPELQRMRVRRGISLSGTIRKLKRPAQNPIDSATEQTLSSFNSPNYLGRGLHQRNRKARKAVERESQGAELRTPRRRLS